MKGSLVILLFFALGVGCGHFHLLPANIDFSQASYAVLCALITCVGFSVGTDRETLRRFRSLSPSLALLPFCSILGTLAGSLCAWLLMGIHPLADWLAVGSGMGYYSLSTSGNTRMPRWAR